MLLSMLTGPQQPPVPQLTLMPDWHPRSYIIHQSAPPLQSSVQKQSLVPKQKAKTPHLSATLICFEFLFLFFYIDTERDPDRLNDLQHTEEKSVARQLCLCRLWVPLKESNGWQQEERRGERMWEGQWRFGTDRCGWMSTQLGWLRENIVLNGPVLEGFYRVRVKGGRMIIMAPGIA